MYSLILKDFYLLRTQPLTLALLGILSVFSCFALPRMPGLGPVVGCYPAFLLVTLACAYDFRYGADSFINSLPVSRRTVLLARFLSVPAIWLASSVVGLAVWLGLSAAGLAAGPAPQFFLSLTFSGSLILCGLYLLSYYLAGFQSARWMSVAILGGIVLLCSLLNGWISPGEAKAALVTAQDRYTSGKLPVSAYLGLSGISLASYALAFLLSWKRYAAREC